MVDPSCPSGITHEQWRRLSPASRRALAPERICDRCGADRRQEPIAVGECYLHNHYFCPACGPEVWEEARRQTAASTSAPAAPTAPPGAPAEAAPKAAPDGARQLSFLGF